jgi:hypothetical protein
LPEKNAKFSHFNSSMVEKALINKKEFEKNYIFFLEIKNTKF